MRATECSQCRGSGEYSYPGDGLRTTKCGKCHGKGFIPMGDEINEIEAVVKSIRREPVKGGLIIELNDARKAAELQDIVNSLTEDEEDALREQGD